MNLSDKNKVQAVHTAPPLMAFHLDRDPRNFLLLWSEIKVGLVTETPNGFLGHLVEFSLTAMAYIKTTVQTCSTLPGILHYLQFHFPCIYLLPFTLDELGSVQHTRGSVGLGAKQTWMVFYLLLDSHRTQYASKWEKHNYFCGIFGVSRPGSPSMHKVPVTTSRWLKHEGMLSCLSHSPS